jgi:serine/threonine-protein kinase
VLPSRPPRTTNLADAAAEARAAALVGTVLSRRYRVVELLAMGGVGAVYLAEHVHMHKQVAVKVLHPDAASLPDLVARFEREAVAGAHVQHPNVAAATDFGELDDGSFFLVLEYVRGTTLRDVIKRGPVPVGRAVRICQQIAAALGAAHAMGIVHRDVKPRNVMLIEGERDVVKLIDFGLAKLDLKQVSTVAASRASSPDARITGTGAVFGTIAYLAPEAAMGMDLVDSRADLYALGLVLYEMLAGKQVFDTTDPVELFKRHHKIKPPPIAERSPGVPVPAAVEAVVMRLLEKTPDARYPTADAVIAALEAAAADLSMSATPPPVQLGDATPMFPGPSMRPPPATPGEQSDPSDASMSPPAKPRSEAPPRAATPQPAAPPVRASATARVNRALGAVVAVLGIAAVAVWWPSGSPRSKAVAGQAASVSALATAIPAAPSAVPAALVSSAPKATASAAPSASAPSASASPAAAPVEGMDAPTARAQLLRSAAARDWAHALVAFFALVDRNPAAFHEQPVLLAARDLTSAVSVVGGGDTDRIFDALGNRLGSDGLDVLYEIVRGRGGTKAALRAEALLRQSEVIARATPEMKITFALREAPCPEKAALLERAVAEGDARTLMALETVGAACLGNSKALQDSIKALRIKLRPR